MIRDIDLDAALPPITSEITIEGNGYTISGSAKFRIFDVDGGKLTISDMTLRNGDAIQGAALRLVNGARVDASNVTFSENVASYGGAVAAVGSNVRLDISDSRFIYNRSDEDGGAMLADGGVVNIERSLFLENSGGMGGAIETRKGNISIANTTFSHNWARAGGATYSHGADTTLTHVTLMNNHARHIVGAGVYHHSGTLKLRNSIVGDNFRTWTDLSGNAFPTSPSYTISGLEGGVRYKVRLRARYHEGGPGDWSAVYEADVAAG